MKKQANKQTNKRTTKINNNNKNLQKAFLQKKELLC